MAARLLGTSAIVKIPSCRRAHGQRLPPSSACRTQEGACRLGYCQGFQVLLRWGSESACMSVDERKILFIRGSARDELWRKQPRLRGCVEMMAAKSRSRWNQKNKSNDSTQNLNVNTNANDKQVDAGNMLQQMFSNGKSAKISSKKLSGRQQISLLDRAHVNSRKSHQVGLRGKFSQHQLFIVLIEPALSSLFDSFGGKLD